MSAATATGAIFQPFIFGRLMAALADGRLGRELINMSAGGFAESALEP
jgi:hypothetical protein